MKPGYSDTIMSSWKKIERCREKEMRKENLKPNKFFIKMEKKVFYYYVLQNILLWNSKEFSILFTVLPILRHTWKNKVWKKENIHRGNISIQKEQKKPDHKATKTIKIFICNETYHPLGR